VAYLPRGKLRLSSGIMPSLTRGPGMGRPGPRVRLRTVSKPDQCILWVDWVFVPPVIQVYNDLEGPGLMIERNSVVRPHIQIWSLTSFQMESIPASVSETAGCLSLCSLWSATLASATINRSNGVRFSNVELRGFVWRSEACACELGYKPASSL
jgi:hypothetical protein